ncbi:MAG: hypothetical protein PVI31_03235 [Gemmatimonadota bacterium]|jgi:hypothetical protein
MVRVLLLALLAAGAHAPPRSARQETDVTPCVVASLPAASDGDTDLDRIRQLFLMRERFWPSGAAAHPVNLPPSAELRERFSRLVLGQSVTELAPYWNERYFHGTRPPPTVASETAVLLFVARTPGAVGYVGRRASDELPQGVTRLMCVGQEGSDG